MMEPEEISELLALMTIYDFRETDEITIAAWQEIIGDLPYGDARDAVIAHYRESRERIMPADVTARVREVMAGRLRRTPAPDPPPEIADDARAYLDWTRRHAGAIARGEAPPAGGAG